MATVELERVAFNLRHSLKGCVFSEKSATNYTQLHTDIYNYMCKTEEKVFGKSRLHFSTSVIRVRKPKD